MSPLVFTIRGSARAADFANLLGRSVDRAPSFACGSAVFAAAQRSRRLALRAPQWQARCFAGVMGNRVLVADLAWETGDTIDRFQACGLTMGHRWTTLGSS
jgi:hypothetical protein